jgi:hypothetical protein
MNLVTSLVTAIAMVLLLLPANARAEETCHCGLFGGMTYGHFAYENQDGGTEPGWGPTLGVFGNLAPFPSDFVLLTIEGSYFRIGTDEGNIFSPDVLADSYGQGISRRGRRETRSYLSAASLLNFTVGGRISPYLHIGPTLNFRLPDGTTYPGAVVFGGIYGIGINADHGRQSFMVEVRYLHHWSSTADENTPPSKARALVFVGGVGF